MEKLTEILQFKENMRFSFIFILNVMSQIFILASIALQPFGFHSSPARWAWPGTLRLRHLSA